MNSDEFMVFRLYLMNEMRKNLIKKRSYVLSLGGLTRWTAYAITSRKTKVVLFD